MPQSPCTSQTMRSVGDRSVAEELADEPRGGDDSGGAIRQGAVEDEEVGVSSYEVVDLPGKGGGKHVGVVEITNPHAKRACAVRHDHDGFRGDMQPKALD